MSTASGAVRCPLLIGRDDLLELADRRLDEVMAGRGQVLLVAGEAGVGKTRFLDAIGQKAAERGLKSAWGFVAPQDHDVPAASVLDLARTMLRSPDFADAGRDLLDLRERTVDAEHVRRRQLVMDVVDRLLAAATGPTLYGFEDLQWADDLSLEIIAELARQSRDRQLFLCGGYRTDEGPPGTSLRDWRSRLLTQRIAEEVRLTPLSKTETALVATLILDTGLPAPREVADAVYERTDGIPLHIEELLGALSAAARANGLAIREATVPNTIEDAVMSRLGHRSPEAQQVARAGAIIGRCFVPDVLAGIMDMPADSIEAPLQELVDNFVLDAPGSRGVYDFRHQLLRDAIYRSVPMGERRKLHARAGEFGAQLEGQSEIHSSLHFERAGLGRQAFEAALAGARDAARLSTHREAFELYRRAVANMPADLPDAERGAILEAAALEAIAIEDNEGGADLARDAVAAFRAASEPVLAIGAASHIASFWRRQGRPLSERVASLETLWAELDGLPDTIEAQAVRAGLAYELALGHYEGRDLSEARTYLATTRRVGEPIDPEYAAIADWISGMIDVTDGAVEAGLVRITAVATAAERNGGVNSGLGAYRDAGLMAMYAMDYPSSTRSTEAGRRYADSVDQLHCAHIMRATSAMVAWAGGAWADSAAEARQAMADRGCRRGAEMARWALAYVALGRGDRAEMDAELVEGYRFGIRTESIEMILPPLWGMAEAALQADDPERAIEACTEARERALAVGERILLVPFIVTGVRAHQAAGRPTAASTWLDACREHLAGIPDVADVALEHGRGLVALSDGATGVARVALESAVRGWDAKGRIWEATWARLDLAMCLIRSNRFADALSFIVDARTTASRLESRPLAERADALHRMARGRVAVDEPWRPLTAREYAVARLISEGYTNAEIADSLGIAPKTASSHVEHILAKLGASRRAEIATWASNVERSPALH